MESIVETAYRLRKTADAGPIGKRHSSFELYDLLGDCMALAARCRQNPVERSELEGLILQQPRPGKRRYVEKGSDEYILVTRFVFHNPSGGAERSNASRYAHTLREAAKQGITSVQLSSHLKENGGINALFLGRPLAARSVTTKALRLAESITVPKTGEFTLVLKRQPDGSFDVVWMIPENVVQPDRANTETIME